MSPVLPRRSFLGAIGVLPLAARSLTGDQALPARTGPMAPKIRLSCNLYSFNEPLRSGAMTLDSVLDFCAELGFDAVDPTG